MRPLDEEPGFKSARKKKTLREGDKCEAKYKGRKWYPGKVRREHSDGSFDIDYEDGEKEKRVEADLVRPRDDYSDDDFDAAPKVGDSVEARGPGMARYKPGTCHKVHVPSPAREIICARSAPRRRRGDDPGRSRGVDAPYPRTVQVVAAASTRPIR